MAAGPNCQPPCLGQHVALRIVAMATQLPSTAVPQLTQREKAALQSLAKRYFLFLAISEDGMEQPPLKKRRLLEEAHDIEPMEVDPPGSKEEPMEVDPPVEDDLMEVDPPPSGHTAHLTAAARPVRKRTCPRCHRRGARIRPPPVKQLP